MDIIKSVQNEKQTIIDNQMQGLLSGNITPEFAFRSFKDEDSVVVKFKEYYNRYVSGELSQNEIEIYNGDWLLALKEKDRKKRSDFISGDGFKLRRDEIAVINNRPITDIGNAERLVDQYNPQIRYCHPMKNWFIWDYAEGRWKQDNNGYIYRIGKDVIRRILIEASRAPNKDYVGKLSSWAYQCECRSHIDGMIEIAKNDRIVVVDPEDFDKNDYLFNIRNGTFNLNSFELQQHKKENNISKFSNFEYNPHAKCPMFIRYLDRVFQSNPNKKDIIGFLQRAVGYTLTGSTQEQCLFLLYGSGANGKSVFLDIISELMGEYGTTTQSKTFTTDRGEISNDIAALAGRRFVCASENSSDSRLDESLIKQLTGGEVISARFLHKEFFTFKPRFKLWWAFNHPPVISDMTNSIWRRLKIIPFTEVLPEKEWDKNLAQKIKDTEIPGIFNWGIEGLKEYKISGLQQPEIISQATRSYKNDQDILLDFFTTMFDFTESERDAIKASVLYASYRDWWLNIESSKPLSSTKFGRLCRDRGIQKEERSEGNFYKFIKFKNKL